VAEATGGQLMGRRHKGYDVLLEEGERVQVKTRSLSVMRKWDRRVDLDDAQAEAVDLTDAFRAQLAQAEAMAA
jgi:hypothetical protein